MHFAPSVVLRKNTSQDRKEKKDFSVEKENDLRFYDGSLSPD